MDIESFKKLTKKQLREYARNECGKNFPVDTDEQVMRLWLGKELGYHIVDTNNKDAATKKKDVPNKVTIEIYKNPLDKSDQPVYLAVNGVNVLVKRGVPVDIEMKYLEVLRNAVETISDQDPNTGEIHRRNVHSYPFSIVGAV